MIQLMNFPGKIIVICSWLPVGESLCASSAAGTPLSATMQRDIQPSSANKTEEIMRDTNAQTPVSFSASADGANDR